MLSSPLFRRNFLLFSILVMIFVALGGVLNWVYRDVQRDRMRHLRPLPVLISSLLEEVDDDPVVAVEKALSKERIRETETLDVVDNVGKSLRSGEQVLAEPLTDDEVAQLAEGHFVLRHTRGSPPQTILATKKANHFFFISPKGRRMPHPPPPLLLPLASLMVSVMLGIGLALYIMSLSYKKKSEEALRVLTAIRNGDLRARLATQGMEELKPIVTSFNAMADEIVALVESLQHTDSARRRLLQDLAHDLRTPLTSVKSFLDTLKNSSDKLSVERRQEVINFCVTEVNYFSDLVEDLLFLANISEPKYVLANDKVDVVSQVRDTVTLFQAQRPGKTISLEVTAENQPSMMGSQKLFERLLRNVLSNAVSFAASQVRVSVFLKDKNVLIRVVDDGPGFSQEALNTFGIKKASRQVFKAEDGSRISLGIGSLIIKEIVMIHRGSVSHYNTVVDGKIAGAVIEMSLPIL